jgi:hypothetical protein
MALLWKELYTIVNCIWLNWWAELTGLNGKDSVILKKKLGSGVPHESFKADFLFRRRSISAWFRISHWRNPRYSGNFSTWNCNLP